MVANENRPSVTSTGAASRDDNADNFARFSVVELDDLAQHADGAFVVVVHVHGRFSPQESTRHRIDETVPVRYRRRVFLTAASAERFARQAQHLGHSAHVYLCELRPVYKLEGAEA